MGFNAPLAQMPLIDNGGTVKIAFVTGHYSPFAGGIETHVREIARILVERGDEITVLTQSDDPSWPSYEVMDGVVVERFPVLFPSRHFAVSVALWHAIRKRRLEWEVVHVHGYGSIVPFLAMCAGATPLVFTPHYHGTGHSTVRRLLHIPYRWIGSLIADASNLIICVSEAERRLFLTHFPSVAKKTIVIPNGVDLQAIMVAEPIRSERTTIVCGGRLETYKHVDAILRAFALLSNEYELVICGDGPERSNLELLARQTGKMNEVRFLGRVGVDELYRWYQTARVYVSMSSNEAMPVAILELLACGSSIVCSDIPAHRDLKSKTNGAIELVTLGSSGAELARAIEVAAALTSSVELAVPTWSDVAEVTSEAYERVLGDR